VQRVKTLLAQSGSSRHRVNSLAIGAKRTLTELRLQKADLSSDV
jgi:hypothetical protein